MEHREDVDAVRFVAVIDCVREARHTRLSDAGPDFGVGVGRHPEGGEYLPDCQGEHDAAAGPPLLVPVDRVMELGQSEASEDYGLAH